MPTVFGLLLAVAAPFCGRLVDRFGVRPVVAVSILFFAGGFYGLSVTSGDFAQVMMIVVAIAVLGSATSAVPYVRLVGTWFAKARGLAIGILMTGSGVAALVLPRVVGPYIQEHGWRAGYQLLAILALLALPLVLLWGVEKKRPATSATDLTPLVADGVSFREAIRTRRFWVLGLAFTLAGTAIAGLIPHFVPLLQDGGMTLADAAKTASFIGMAIIAGRLITGFLCDHMFAPYVAALVLVIVAVGCLGLALLGVNFAIIAAILVGFGMGAEIDLAGYMSSRYFGLKAYGAIFGFQYGMFSLGAGLGPLLFGALNTAFGNYQMALTVAGVGLLVAIPMVLSLGRYPDLTSPQSKAA